MLVFQTQTVQASKPNFSHLSELIYSVGFYNRYIDQSQNKKPKMRQTILGQPGEDEYAYKQGQRGYPIEGSSRPPADPRVQHPSNYPDQRSSYSIPIPTDRSKSIPIRQDPSRVGGASWKGDKYSRRPQKDMFNPYSSSSRPTDPVDPSSHEEASSDDSYSSNGSGSETAAPNPRSGRGTGSRGTYKTRSTAPSIPVPALPPLGFFRGSSNPSGLSKSKSQQPWVAEPSGYKEKESARLPAPPTSSRQDPRGREADTNFSVGSYRGEVGGGLSGLSISKATSQQPWVGGQPATSSDSQSRSSHKGKEGARGSGQPSSSRPDPLGRIFLGSYRGEAGSGFSGHPSDSQSRSGNREKESARSSGQLGSSHPDRRDRADTDFVVGSYRGEPGGGISGHPSDSQSRLSNREKEGAGSRRQESRVRGTDEDYVAGGQGSVEGYRGEAGGGFSGHPSDNQSRSDHKEKESIQLPMQPSSSRADPRARGADTRFVLGSYRGGVSGGILGHPSDSQSHREKESVRLSTHPSSSRADPQGRGADTRFVLGSYRESASGGILGHPSDSRSHSSHKEKESTQLPMPPSSSRADPQGRRADTKFVLGSHRGEASSGILGHPSDSQSRSGHREKESARSSAPQSPSHQEPRVRGTDTDDGTGGQGSVRGYRGEASGGASGQPQLWIGKPVPAPAASSKQQPSGKQPEYTTGGLNRIPYIERDNRGSTLPTETMGTTAHSSRFLPNPTASIPQRKEDSPPYHTRGSGWGREWSSQPADPSRTTPHSVFPLTRPPQHEAQHSHPSQVQGSLGSQRQEYIWDRGLARSSGGRDLISNPSADATGPHPWGGQPTDPPPGWSAHPAHRVFFLHLCLKSSNHGL